MSESLELHERVTRLEEKTIQNTNDICELKALSGVVNEISNTINKLSDTVNTVNESVKMMAETTKEIQQVQHDTELIKKHSFSNHVWGLIKSISIPQWIIYIGIGAGIIIAIKEFLIK